MTNTSSKSKKRVASDNERRDHPIGCRVSSAQLERIDIDISGIKQSSGLSISRGAYCKHAVLEYRRLRRLEVKLKQFAASEGGMAITADDARIWLQGSQ